MHRLKAVLFDVYGTLLDVRSVAAVAEAMFPGDGAALSSLWREKQLQYSWLRTLSDRYADFWQVTGDALDYASEALHLRLSPADRARLMNEYEGLTAFPDAASALQALRRSGLPLAVLSNGTPRMLERTLSNAGLRDRFASILSVDAVRQYKTAPAAYGMAAQQFGAAPAELVLVSSNGWDVAGAASFGLATFWVNRTGAPVERLGVEPTAVGRSLADLPAWLAHRITPRDSD